MPSFDSLRASDADRDAVTERLRVAAGEGRLDQDELEQRVDAALRARTYGELARLTADLPGERRRAPRQSSPLVRGAVIGVALVVAAVVVVAVAALVMLAAAAWWVLLIAFCMFRCHAARAGRRWGSSPARVRSISARRIRHAR